MRKVKRPAMGAHPRSAAKKKQRSNGVKKAARTYNTRLNIRKGK